MRSYRFGILLKKAILKVTKKANTSSSEELVVLLVLGGLKEVKEEHVAFFILDKILFFPKLDKIRFFPNCKFSHFWAIKNLWPASEYGNKPGYGSGFN